MEAKVNVDRKMQERKRPELDETSNNLETISIRTEPSRLASYAEDPIRNELANTIQFYSTSIEHLNGELMKPDPRYAPQLFAVLILRSQSYAAIGLLGLAKNDAERAVELFAEMKRTHVADHGSSLSGAIPSDKRSSTQRVCPLTDNRVAHSRQSHHAAISTGHSSAKRQKREERLSQSTFLGVLEMPTEIILTIAHHLDPVSRIRLAGTHPGWRKLPHLWQSLHFSRIDQVSVKGWHRDSINACIDAIQTCQVRSHGTLASVILKGFITPNMVGRILDALRSSSATLTHLAIPTLDQSQCYDKLYQHCHSLSGIDVRLCLDEREPNLCEENLLRSTHLFCSAKVPFRIKTFVGSPDYDCGNVTPHLEGFEVVRGLHLKRQKRPDFISALRRAAPTLIEWRDCPDNKWDNTLVSLDDYGMSVQDLPQSPIIFPKLRKLNALWAESVFDCDFPVLIEARFHSLRVPWALARSPGYGRNRVASAIHRSPSLKKLDVLLPGTHTALKQIFTAIGQLEHLEELGLWSPKTISLQAFVDVQYTTANEHPSRKIMCPALKTLRLSARMIPTRFEKELERELSEMLLSRFYLSNGHKLNEVRARTKAALSAHQVMGFVTQMDEDGSVSSQSSLGKTAVSRVLGGEREIFEPVLTTLIITRGLSKNLIEGNQSLLNQLILEIHEVGTYCESGAYTGVEY
ncbi:uncharacterized protein UTRI_04187 [Ustilago trichophora]|uniref:F-box domain-containing protein n=1 Tax=Ustilago trichophora TaxID=86804 RepID=A0A5C3EPE3_9BASI|nr:uncharacterized protein UTRI_04187_B [Ustilago trichophora]SPO32443.1 uncharacterized protein UTRI_04187 [Ustilago trichophora]